MSRIEEIKKELSLVENGTWKNHIEYLLNENERLNLIINSFRKAEMIFTDQLISFEKENEKLKTALSFYGK